MEASYKTIKVFAQAEFTEKKSRFIGYITPVETVSEAEEFIEKISKQHYNATHNVYAYCLSGGQIYRYSDNGEPQGTAGIPVLDVIKKTNLTNVCIVATRYFGGIMLGAGGLVRAYSHTATIAIEAAEMREMVPCTRGQLMCNYSLYGKLTHIFPQFNVVVEASDFAENVILCLLLETENLDNFNREVTELTSAQAQFEVVESDVMSDITRRE